MKVFGPSKLCRQALSTSTRCMSGHSTSTRHGNDPEVLEKGKQSVLRKHSKNSTEEPHWHEELASDSEAFIKAQRDEIDTSKEGIKKLQEETKNRPTKN
ncbi:hypothetical protein EDC01DRAFT_782133 [Geopyxis carbonaria]|nr:hypothetical protein EDC01DRAFT_782133 [Geopyxis carbonaria]